MGALYKAVGVLVNVVCFVGHLVLAIMMLVSESKPRAP